MALSRDETVETVVKTAPGVMIEDRIVEEGGPVRRVVHSAAEAPSAFPAAAEVARTGGVRRRTVTRFWRRRADPRRQVVGGEYVAVGESELGQFLRMSWFLLGLIEMLLGVRFMLALLAANPGNDFASFVDALTWPFVAPFRSLFATPAVGFMVFEGYTLIAMIVIFGAWLIAVRFLGVLLNRSVEV